VTVQQLAAELSLVSLTLPDPQREVEGVYIGDLLSWVMGRAQSGNAWITIMSNLNIVAVATLADVSCIILAEGVTLDEQVKETAASKDINILATDMTAYQVASALSGLGL